MRVGLSAFVVCAFVMTSAAKAEIDSGPKAGTAISPLKVFAATGDRAGQELDFAAERGAKPTVYVFVQHERFDRPLARILRVLEKAATEAGNETGLATVFLTNDEAKTKEHLPRIQTSMNFTNNPLLIYPSGTTSPDGWSINSDAYLTVIVVKAGKVVQSFAYRSANESVVPEITKLLK
jgi:hypothetical protein